jgi:muramoyltetrapeptide carboxypeptidase
VPENDVPFGETAEEIAQDWCNRAGIPYLGRADIGHDADNKIVPFGVAGRG